MPSQTYRSLEMWQTSHRWVLDIYSVSRSFPKSELYGLTSQLRRAASSVPMNMAEGYGRRGIGDKLRFYNFAEGSLNEADYQLLLAHDLGYADTRDLQAQASAIARMLYGYTARLRRSGRDDTSI